MLSSYVHRIKFIGIISALYIANFATLFNESVSLSVQNAVAAEFEAIDIQIFLFVAYLIPFTATPPLLGKLCDIFGRAAVFNAAIFLLTTGSILCAISQDFRKGYWLVGLRFVQSLGVCTGMMLGSISPLGPQRWRWLFWIVIIIQSIAYPISVSYMRYPVPARTRSTDLREQLRDIDWGGSLLAFGMVASLFSILSLGNHIFPWNRPPHPHLHPLRAQNRKITHNQHAPLQHPQHPPRLPPQLHQRHRPPFPNPSLPHPQPSPSPPPNPSPSSQSSPSASPPSSPPTPSPKPTSPRFRLTCLTGTLLYTLSASLTLTTTPTTPTPTLLTYTTLLALGAGTITIPSSLLGPLSGTPPNTALIVTTLHTCYLLGAGTSTVLISHILAGEFLHALRSEGFAPGSVTVVGGVRLPVVEPLPPNKELVVEAVGSAYRGANVPAVVLGVVFALALLGLRGLDVRRAPVGALPSARPSEGAGAGENAPLSKSDSEANGA